MFHNEKEDTGHTRRDILIPFRSPSVIRLLIGRGPSSNRQNGCALMWLDSLHPNKVLHTFLEAGQTAKPSKNAWRVLVACKDLKQSAGWRWVLAPCFPCPTRSCRLCRGGESCCWRRLLPTRPFLGQRTGTGNERSMDRTRRGEPYER